MVVWPVKYEEKELEFIDHRKYYVGQIHNRKEWDGFIGRTTTVESSQNSRYKSQKD